MDPTPTKNNLPLRKGDFTNLAEALDYAAQGNTGYNFYNGTGKLSAALPYKRLRKEARSLARRLLGLGPRPGARVALVADTHPDFMRYFFPGPPRLPQSNGRLTINPGGLGESTANRKAGRVEMTKMI